ncbi:MAG: hypothetical protein ABIJ41_07515 [Candidatus Omnitrophota bacterium]
MSEENTQERKRRLRDLAKKIGVSASKIEDSAGRDDENLIERIEQRYICVNASRAWVIALISAIASAFSALAAWVTVFVKYRYF